MKLFDEALQIVMNQDLDVFNANFQDALHFMENEKFVHAIQKLSMNIICIALGTNQALVGNDIFAGVCSQIHGVFQLGLLVGTEMEKPELSEDILNDNKKSS